MRTAWAHGWARLLSPGGAVVTSWVCPVDSHTTFLLLQLLNLLLLLLQCALYPDVRTAWAQG
jgi:hypothetical protein